MSVDTTALNQSGDVCSNKLHATNVGYVNGIHTQARMSIAIVERVYHGMADDVTTRMPPTNHRARCLIRSYHVNGLCSNMSASIHAKRTPFARADNAKKASSAMEPSAPWSNEMNRSTLLLTTTNEPCMPPHTAPNSYCRRNRPQSSATRPQSARVSTQGG